MSSDFSTDPRQALEVSLTALVLGELPPDQAEFLRRAMTQDPELARTYERLRQTIDLVQETEKTPAQQPSTSPEALKLSEDRRQELLQHFKTVAPKEFEEPASRSFRWLVPVGIAAVFLLLVGSLLLPVLGKAKSKGYALNERAAKGYFAQVVPVSTEAANLMQEHLTPPSPIAPPASEVEALHVKPTIVLPSLAQDKKADISTEMNGAFGGFAANSPVLLAENAAKLAEYPPGLSLGLENFAGRTIAPAKAAPMAQAGDFFYRAPTAPEVGEKLSIQESLPAVTLRTENVPPSRPGATPGAAATADSAAQLPAQEIARSSAPYGPADRGKATAISGGDQLQASGESEKLAGNRKLARAAESIGKPKDEASSAAGLAGLEKQVVISAPLSKAPGTALGAVSQKQEANLGHALRQEENLSEENARVPVLGDRPLVGKAMGEGSVDLNRNPPSEFVPQVALHWTATPSNSTALPRVQIADAGSAAREYSEAKRELEELQRFKQTVTLKMEAEMTDLKLPKSKMVDIVDLADTNSHEAPGFGARLRRAITGGVEKKARINLERASSDVSGLSLASSGTFDPYFVLTEKEVIQSDAVLGKVVDDLKLGEEWGRKAGRSEPLSKADAVQHLKSMLDVKEVPNSSLVDIGVKSSQSEEAAKLANAVAEKYRDYRNEERTRLTMGGIEALQKRLSETEKQAALAQGNVDRLQQKVATKSADEPPAKPAVPPPVPQPEVQAADNAFSTFSLNVSDVSFKTAAASLEKGLMPEPGTIRSEEFINAFDYRDPEPAPGMPVGFCWDRARYPFAQNRDVLRFALKTASRGRSAGQPLNIVLLLDNSGSMERADRVRIIREALKVLAAQLQPQDKLSVVTFARTPQLRVDGVPGNQAGEKLAEISELTPQGGTNLEEAMNAAYQTALKHYLPNGINRVVLLTDGAANLGDVQPENLKKKVEEHRKQGIALDCFGIGWEGYNDDLLESLTRNGDGRYGFINTPEEAATEFAPQLAGALHVAASDVKVQVEFNPKRITAWRQIGYAKHQLTKEQFRDNTVDAAEIGAAESGNALYIVEVNSSGEGPLGTVRIRYKVPGTSDYHEHEWTVPFNGSGAALDQSSPALKLATTASAFSEWLATSPYAAEVTTDALLRYVSGVPEVFGADPRPQKLEWMIRQAARLGK